MNDKIRKYNNKKVLKSSWEVIECYDCVERLFWRNNFFKVIEELKNDGKLNEKDIDEILS